MIKYKWKNRKWKNKRLLHLFFLLHSTNSGGEKILTHTWIIHTAGINPAPTFFAVT